MRVRTPRPDGGCHQCCTSPSTNCRAAARRSCSRARSRRAHGERHHVLELIAEAVRAARLVERRARPDAARERLVEQPAVEQQVERPVGRLHLHAPTGCRPSASPTARSVASTSAVAVARDQRARLVGGRGLAEQEHDLRARSPGAARPSSAARRTDRGRRRRLPDSVAPALERRRAGRACRCGRGTPSGRRSTPV